MAIPAVGVHPCGVMSFMESPRDALQKALNVGFRTSRVRGSDDLGIRLTILGSNVKDILHISGMAHTARPDSRSPAPALARDCERCNGWGTVITPQARHELCAACQHPTQLPPSAAPPQRPALSEG
ncbi:hypothetical protein GCM10010307_48450 [Streptomyces vastus]|uniref:Uncharacterized protein n=1 Tax=Streptomyces vastus TaxID=285451 RepID=A0ABN3R5H5_9ACTN